VTVTELIKTQAVFVTIDHIHSKSYNGDDLLYNKCYGIGITFRVKANAIVIEEHAPCATCLVFQRYLIPISFKTIPPRDILSNMDLSVAPIVGANLTIKFAWALPTVP
jgi:hypothetical protein